MQPIEPNILPTFRGFIAITIVFMMCGVLGALNENHSAIPLAGSSILITSIVLWFYLRSNQAEKTFGAYYLPLALILATTTPILGSMAETILNIVAYNKQGMEALYNPGVLTIYLLLPLILVCTQYGMRMLVLFISLTSLFPPLLILPLFPHDSAIHRVMIDNAIIRAILFMMVGYMVVRITTNQRKGQSELALKNTQLSHYALTLEQLATSRERNRMARELHDTLAHTLSAVSIQLEALDALWENDPTAARSMLAQTKDQTRSGLHEARRALSALRASPLEDLGLRLALSNLAQTAADRAGIQLHLSLPPALPEICPQVEQVIYRIAEEALTNVVRHANAQNVNFNLLYTPASLELSIHDDGRGFDSAALSNSEREHYGLLGMHERATLGGGSVSIQSTPGKGTHVMFSLRTGLMNHNKG